jgi:hypothetical protein
MFCRYRLDSYVKDGNINSYKIWLHNQCLNLQKQNDSVVCLRWLRDFTNIGGLSPIEEHLLISNKFVCLNEGFKLCNGLRQVIQIAAKELLSSWLLVSAHQLVHCDAIYGLLCRIKITFFNVSQVCQTESGRIAAFLFLLHHDTQLMHTS